MCVAVVCREGGVLPGVYRGGGRSVAMVCREGGMLPWCLGREECLPWCVGREECCCDM